MTSIMQKQISQYRNMLYGKRVCYVDVPVYHNYGDFLIFLGAVELFKIIEVDVLHFFSLNQIKSNIGLVSKMRPDVIVCQGGGNFGDVYLAHNTLRKIVVQNFPETPVIFLPQSIYYENKKNLERDFEVFNKHNKLTIFLRDFESLELVKELSHSVPSIGLDTAEFLSFNPKFSKPKVYNKTHKTLYFTRKDSEKKHGKTEIRTDEIDWDYFFSSKDRVFKFIMNQAMKICSISFFASNILIRFWVRHMLKKLDAIIMVFCSHDEVVTDRLHANILGKLLRKDVIVPVDNSYGKIGRYDRALEELFNRQ